MNWVLSIARHPGEPRISLYLQKKLGPVVWRRSDGAWRLSDDDWSWSGRRRCWTRRRNSSRSSRRSSRWSSWWRGQYTHTLHVDKCVRLLILWDHLFNLLPRLLFCTRTILKKGWMHLFLQIILIQFILYLKLSYCKIAQRGKEFNEFCLSNSSDDLCLFFCINPSSMLETLLFGKETQTKLNTKCKNKFCHN